MRIWSTVMILGGVAGLLSFCLTALVRGYAVRAGVLDHPNPRSSHTIPTPRGGGLAFLAAATVGIGIAVGIGIVSARFAVTLGAGAWTLAAIGWVDDRRHVSARLRLILHFLVAMWTVYRLGGLPTLRAGSVVIPLGWSGYLLAVMGLVWGINLFNFMDGIDALAASQAAIVLGTVAVLLVRLGDVSLGVISATLAAAAAGFLPWNWPRARIFLGDVGSGPIGYLVGSIAVASENAGDVPLLVVAIMSSIFIADATVTLIRRGLRRERLAEAHRSHAYQRLAQRFNSHAVVSLGAGVATALFALLGATATLHPNLFKISVFIAVTVLIAVLTFAEWRAPMPRSSTTHHRGDDVCGGDR